MNTCLYCGNPIEEKTKSGKPRKYCNKSCSRKHYCENNKEALIETNKRGYQTLIQNFPEKVADRSKKSGEWYKTKEGKMYVRELHKMGHYHEMANKAAKIIKNKERTPEHIAKWKETYKKNGYMLENPTEWKQYNRKCRNMTRKLYGSAGDGYVWDHIVPISYGFKNAIPPEKICSKENVRKVTGKRNREKWMHLTEESHKILSHWSEAYA